MAQRKPNPAYDYRSQGYRRQGGQVIRPDESQVGALADLPSSVEQMRQLGYTEADVQAILAAQKSGQEDGLILVDPLDAYASGGSSGLFQALYGNAGGSATGKRPLKLLKGLLGRLTAVAAPTAPAASSQPASAGGSPSGPTSYPGLPSFGTTETKQGTPSGSYVGWDRA